MVQTHGTHLEQKEQSEIDKNSCTINLTLKSNPPFKNIMVYL